MPMECPNCKHDLGEDVIPRKRLNEEIENKKQAVKEATDAKMELRVAQQSHGDADALKARIAELEGEVDLGELGLKKNDRDFVAWRWGKADEATRGSLKEYATKQADAASCDDDQIRRLLHSAPTQQKAAVDAKQPAPKPVPPSTNKDAGASPGVGTVTQQDIAASRRDGTFAEKLPTFAAALNMKLPTPAT